MAWMTDLRCRRAPVCDVMAVRTSRPVSMARNHAGRLGPERHEPAQLEGHFGTDVKPSGLVR
jgi:hypothetical protein